MTDYTSVVRAGIEFLDRNYVGDWRKKIDLDGLDISSCDVCVLGQVFGGYDNGLSTLGIDSYKARDYGFTTDYSMGDLTEAWKDALGKDNSLVEQGQIWSDSSGCCFIKVVGTKLTTIDGVPTMIYITQSGEVDRDKQTFKPHGGNFGAKLRKDFGEGASQFTEKVKFFSFKAGQFITNSTGKVYYVQAGGEYGQSREIKDQSYAVYNNEINKDGIREVRLPNGKLFSDTVTK